VQTGGTPPAGHAGSLEVRKRRRLRLVRAATDAENLVARRVVETAAHSLYLKGGPRPLRLEAQDTALSRRQHRFESGRGRQSYQSVMRYSRGQTGQSVQDLANKRPWTYPDREPFGRCIPRGSQTYPGPRYFQI
jgi:hypothetical protein